MIFFDIDIISKVWDDIVEENEEIRIIFIGRRNFGKIVIVNIILGYLVFDIFYNFFIKFCWYGMC